MKSKFDFFSKWRGKRDNLSKQIFKLFENKEIIKKMIILSFPLIDKPWAWWNNKILINTLLKKKWNIGYFQQIVKIK